MGFVLRRELLERLLADLRSGDAERVGRALAWLLESRAPVPRHTYNTVLEPPVLGYVHQGSGVVGVAMAPLPARMRAVLFKSARTVPPACFRETAWVVFAYKPERLPAEHLAAALCCSSLAVALWAAGVARAGADAVVDDVRWHASWEELPRETRREVYEALAATALGVAQRVHGVPRGSGVVAFVMAASTLRRLLADFDDVGVEYFAPSKVGKRRTVYVAVKDGRLARIKLGRQ